MFQFIKNLFINWEMVYSTPDAEKHFAAIQKLKNNGIMYKTKTINFGGAFGKAFGGGFGGGGGESNSMYHIYVPKTAMHKANQAIHQKE